MRNRGAESGSKLAGGTGAGTGGAWESTKYQLEGKLLFTKYQAERENQKEQAKVSLLKRFRK